MLNKQLYVVFLRRNLRLCLLVSIGCGLVFGTLAALFPGMDTHEASLVSSSWPQAMKDLFGDPAYAFADVYAWLNLEVFHITSWAAYGVCACILASRIVAGEIEGRTLGVLLSCGVSRPAVLTSGMAAVFTLMLAGMVPGVAGLALGVASLGLPVRLGMLLLAVAAVLLLSMVLAAVTLLLSVLGMGQTLSVFLTLAIAAFLFLFDGMLVKLIPALERLGFLSPFLLYTADEILIHGRCDPVVFALLSAWVFLPAAAAAGVFARKDIPG